MSSNIFDGADDGSILGTSQSDVIYGGESVGNANGGTVVNDTIDGGQSDDTIYAGDGDDLIFGGDAGDATGGENGAKEVNSFEFDVAKADPIQAGTGQGHIGDSILYRNVATAEDGSQVSVRITVVDQTNPNLRISLGHSSDYPILINEGSNSAMQGESVDIKIEFLDSSGNPCTIDSNFTFRDIDDTGSNGQEGVTFDTTDITSYAVSGDPGTNVQVDDRGDEIEFTTNANGEVADENLWTQVFFEGQSTLNFTLEARAHNAGYGFDTADFANPPVITEVDASGDDVLYGGAGNDSALGGGGNDTLFGEDGNDRLDGGEGNDVLFGGSGSDTFVASEGTDTIFGGTGQDFVDYSAGNTGVTVDLGAGTSSNGDVLSGVDGVIGSSQDDTLIGFDAESTSSDAFTNVIYGGAGDDLIDGKAGSDSLFGGLGNDSILGGDGNDLIRGGAGADTIDAGAGNDSVDGGDGNDLLYGGDGNDVLSSGSGSDTVFGGDGDDTVLVTESTQAGRIEGGEGYDVIDASGSSQGVDGNLGSLETGSIDTGAGTSSFEDIEKLVLSNNADTITSASDAGDITIEAGAGNDSIASGAGNDVIDAGAGNDTLDSGTGDDTLTGGSGADVFVIRSADFSDLGTEEEIREVILLQNANGIDGWRGLKGEGETAGETEDEVQSAAEVYDIKEIGKEVGDALKPMIGGKEAGEAEKAVEEALQAHIDANPGVGLSPNDISTIAFNTLKPELGFIKAGVASLKTYSVAKDQAEIAAEPGLGDPDDIDDKKIGDHVEDTLKDSIDDKDAKDIGKDVEKDVDDFINDNGTDGVSPDQIGQIAYDAVVEEYGVDVAELTRAAATEKAAEQLGVDQTSSGPTDPTDEIDPIAQAILDRASHTEIEDFEIGTDRLDFSNIDYMGETGLATNDVRISDTVGDGTGDAVLNLPEGSTITLKDVSVFDLDPETLETMGFNEADDATGYQNEFLVAAGQIGGGGGDDAIEGSENAETISGGTGADTLLLGGGADSVLGGDDEDQIIVADGFDGSNVDGGSGGTDHDVLDFHDLTTGVTVTGTTGESGDMSDGVGANGQFAEIEEFEGTANEDLIDFSGATGNDGVSIDANEGADSIAGGGGDDTLSGGEGDDTVAGGVGSDIVYGGEGNDSLTTGTGNDTLFGGEGDDHLANSSGDDILYGGSGDDSVVASLGDDTLYGGADDDDLIGGSDNDVLYGGAGDDSLVGGSEVGPTATKFGFEYYETDGETNSTLADVGFDASGNTTRTPDADGTIDTINVNALDAANGGSGETFAVKFSTVLTVSSSGTYTFETTSDDGSKLFVNGTEIVNNDGLHPLVSQSGSLALGAGEHVVEIIYFEHTGGEGLTVTVSGPDTGGSPVSLESANIAASDDDLLLGEAGNDQINGGLGDDTIYGGDDQDTISVTDNFGSDTVYGGEGGTDADTLDLSALGGGVTVTYTGAEDGTFTDGTDTGTFFEIEDVILTDQDDSFNGSSSAGSLDIDGASGNDTISGSDNASNGDTIVGGAGNDVLDGLGGNDTIFGGAGNDTIKAGFGSDTFDGGSGTDTYDIGSSNVSAFNFNVNLVSGNDQYGNVYSDIENVVGGTAADSFTGNSASNVLDGGAGNDTLDGGAGNDTLTGGTGDDTFRVSASGGNDTVTDFGTGNDQIDSSALTDVGNVLTDQDGTVTADEVVVSGGGGSAQVLTFPNGETMTVPDGTVDTSTTATQFASLVAIGVPPCFAPGTMILTPSGEVAVEFLRVGDLVMTADRGPQPLRWIGKRVETFTDRDDPNKPILIAEGALGDGFPTQDLIVSPQHRMVLSGKVPEILFGQRDVMAIAKGLTDLKGIRRMAGKAEITYYALLLDRHEVIFAEGAATESFRPGSTVLKDMDERARQEIYRIYPMLEAEPTKGLGDSARLLLTGRDSRRIGRRLAGAEKNRLKRKSASASVHALKTGPKDTHRPTV